MVSALPTSLLLLYVPPCFSVLIIPSFSSPPMVTPLTNLPHSNFFLYCLFQIGPITPRLSYWVPCHSNLLTSPSLRLLPLGATWELFPLLHISFPYTHAFLYPQGLMYSFPGSKFTLLVYLFITKHILLPTILFVVLTGCSYYLVMS